MVAPGAAALASTGSWVASGAGVGASGFAAQPSAIEAITAQSTRTVSQRDSRPGPRTLRATCRRPQKADRPGAPTNSVAERWTGELRTAGAESREAGHGTEHGRDRGSEAPDDLRVVDLAADQVASRVPEMGGVLE